MSRHPRQHTKVAIWPAYGRRLVGLVGAMALMLVAGCGDDGDESSQHTSDDGQTPTEASAERAIRAMQLCDLVDLDALILEAMQGQYEPDFPTDVGLGAGTDLGAVKCFALFSPPDVMSHGASIAGIGDVLIGVIPYATVAEATAGFDDRWNEGTVERLADVSDVTVSEPQPLTGPWDRGFILTSVGDATIGVHALVQQDNYLLRIKLSYDNDDDVDVGYPFTLDDVVAASSQLMTAMHTGVTAEIETE